jgi:hypothetical protein
MTITSSDVNPPKEEAVVEKPQKRVRKPAKEAIAPKSELAAAFQAYEEAVKEATGGRVLMKMERENQSFVTDSGVKFTRSQPYQLVPEHEVELLLKQNFRKAYPEEVTDFYAR